ncbi:MAG: hypothetical protein AAF620_19265 [Bacteroidota bacterium]
MVVSFLLTATISLMSDYNYQDNCKEYIFSDSKELGRFFETYKDLAEIRCLRVCLKKNMKTWVFYSDNGLGQQECYFELQDNIKFLPNEVSMPSIEQLDLSLLGLKKFPDFLVSQKNLRNLNLSFNRFDINAALEKLMEMKQLQVLTIFGYNIHNEAIDKLQQSNPRLHIFFSKEQYRASLNKE